MNLVISSVLGIAGVGMVARLVKNEVDFRVRCREQINRINVYYGGKR